MPPLPPETSLDLGTAVDLAEIAIVRVAAAAATVAEQFNGGTHKRRPTQIVEAQFALPYLIAAAIVHGRVGITEVADIHHAQVLNIAERMEGVDAGRDTSGVTVRLRDGRTATANIGPPLGSPENRLSIEQLKTKFVDCARNAVRPLSDDAVRCGHGHDPSPGRRAGCQRTAAALRLRETG